MLFTTLQKILFISAVLATFQSCHHTQNEAPEIFNGYPVDSNLVFLTHLPSNVWESSGLIYFDNQLWTLNDSGDEPRLYQIAKEAETLQHNIQILNAKNTDWEGMTQDSHFVYIGDFGNNGGKRKDLGVYKVAKSTLKEDTTSLFEKITFSYADQTRFDYAAHQHDFDCESIIATEDSLYLFSKNFIDKQTRVYSLPKSTGNYSLHPKAKFDVQGTLTDATFNSAENLLALLGYNFQEGNFFPFVWLFWDFEGQDFFGGKSQRVNFPVILQAEGICHYEGYKFFISTEAESGGKGNLFLFDASSWLK